MPVFPIFSEDLLRYRWEGRVQAAGLNPYAVSPDDPQAEHLKDETFERIPARNVWAGYGPLWELAERATWGLVSRITPNPSSQLVWFKLPSVLGDLAAIAALLALLRAHGLPLQRIAIYAWCPLPLVEFWTSGHNDAWIVAFLALALWAAQIRRWTAAFAALTGAALIKFWPFLLFPLFVFSRPGRPRLRQWLIAIPLTLVCLIPYLDTPVKNLLLLRGLLGGWRNNDSLYGLFINSPALSLGLMAVLVLALIRVPLETGVLAATAGILLLSANVHPWYLTWLLPPLTLVPWTPLLLWICLAPLFYEALIEYHWLGRWEGVRPSRWLVYVPVFGLALAKFIEQGMALARKIQMRRS